MYVIHFLLLPFSSSLPKAQGFEDRDPDFTDGDDGFGPKFQKVKYNAKMALHLLANEEPVANED